MSGEGLISSKPVWETGEGVRRMRRGTVICPVCEYDAKIRGSERVTPTVTTLWCACTNLLCGMTWRAQISFEHVISPSGLEASHVALPHSPASSTGPPVSLIAPATVPIGSPGNGGGGEDEAQAA